MKSRALSALTLICGLIASQTGWASVQLSCDVSVLEERPGDTSSVELRKLGEFEPEVFTADQKIEYARETRDVKVKVTSKDPKKAFLISIQNLANQETAEWSVHPKVIRAEDGATLHLVTPQGIRSTRSAREVTVRCHAQ